MRVLFWSDLFWPYVGGIETQAARLLPLLRQRGLEFAVATSHRNQDLPDQEQWQGITIRRFPFRQVLERRDLTAFFLAQREAKSFIDRFGPEVLHLNGIGPSAAICMRIARQSDMPFLVSLHQQLFASQLEGSDSLLQQLLSSADWVHAVSPFVVNQARELVPELEQRSSVIHNSLEVPATRPAPLPSSPARLLCLGRLIPQKGFDLALEAFAIVSRRFADLALTIGGDGESRPELEQRARALGVADRVDFLGWISPDDVTGLLHNSTMLVMPSRREGFGVVAAEAALMGRPVVGTCAGGLQDVVEDGVTGLLVEQENPVALANAITDLLLDLDKARAMGIAARKRAIQLFDQRNCIGQYERLYRRLAGERG